MNLHFMHILIHLMGLLAEMVAGRESMNRNQSFFITKRFQTILMAHLTKFQNDPERDGYF